MMVRGFLQRHAACAACILALPAATSLAGDMTATVVGAGHRIGDPIVVRYEFAGDPGDSLLIGSLPPSVGAFDVVSAVAHGPRAVEITWIGWDAEAKSLPTLPITVLDAAGASREIALPDASIALESTLAADDPLTDFGAHKGPLDMPWEWSPVTAAGILSAVAIGGCLVGLWLSRPRRIASPTPEERAMAALDGLAARELASAADGERFWIDLTDVLRSYIGERFGLQAPLLTTREFLDAARGSLPVEDVVRDRLRSLLTFADRVKFARQGASNVEAAQGMAFVRTFVSDCTPHAPGTESNAC